MVDAEQLGRAVIKQALADAGVGMLRGHRISVSEIERNRARDFLTAATGSWKAAREFWASLADLDASKLRTGSMKALGIEPAPARPPQPTTKPTCDRPLQLFYPVPKPPKPPRVTPREQLRRIAQQDRPSRPQESPSKRQQVLAMLMRPEGVSLDEIVARFGWKRTTAQTSIGYDLRNYGVQGKRGSDGRYRAVEIN